MFLRLLCCLATIIVHFSALSASYTVVEDKADLPILSPSFEGVRTLKLRLDNGLEAYIVSDPGAANSSAALAVEVGSNDTPPEHPGLAHFLEHLLFLGTKQYPEEKGFQDFIYQHSGLTNAYTSDHLTVFMFYIDNASFEPALDRFASFFKDPLFNASGVARELHAIEQEFDRSCTNDSWRQLYILRETANQAHPFTHFSCGNMKTLSSVSREMIEAWYKSHYSANLMRVVVHSPLPLDQLKEYVVAKFQEIPNIDRNALRISEKLSPEGLHGQMVYIEPVKDLRELTIWWELPEQFVHKLSIRPDVLVSYLLGYEGEGSLLSQLKEEKLVERLGVSTDAIGAEGMILQVSIDLTAEGLKKRDLVIERVFQAIASLKSEGVPEYVFHEIRKMQMVQYQYPKRDKGFDFVQHHVAQLFHEPLDTYPLQTYVIQKFDPEAANALLAYLTPEHAHFLVDARLASMGLTPDKKEKWVGIPYTVQPIAPETMEKWMGAQPHHNIHIPAPNPFIPNGLSLVNRPEGNQVRNATQVITPKLIANTTQGKAYYAPDTHYLTPEVWWSFTVRTPEVDPSRPETIVLADLYVKTVGEALQRLSDPARVAGLRYDIYYEAYGIGIVIAGYSDHAATLLGEILKQVRSLTISDEQFKLYKEILLKKYENFSLEEPYKRAAEILKSAFYVDFVTEADKARAIKRISYKATGEYFKKLWSKTYIEAMLFGNLTEQQATEAWELVASTLSGSPYPPDEQRRLAVVTLAADQGPFYLESKSKAPGYAALLAVQNVPFSYKNWAIQKVLHQAFSSSFFDALRTKQKTGYVVSSGAEEMEDLLFMRFVVQSSGHEAQNLLSRFEFFLETCLRDIGESELSENKFKTIRDTLVTNLEQPPNSLEERGRVLTRLAFVDRDFNRNEKNIRALKDLTYAECVARAREVLGCQNRRRLAVLVEGIPPQVPAVYPYIKSKNGKVLKEKMEE